MKRNTLITPLPSVFRWLIISVVLQAAAQHPCILFSKKNIPEMKLRAKGSHAAIIKPILSKADALLGEPLPTYPNGPSSKTSQWGGNLSVLAFAHVVTGDARYLDQARKHLLAFASWPHWGLDRSAGDRDLGLGYMIRGNAMAYDWLYDSLPAQDRMTIRISLGNHAQEMFEAATSPNNNEWKNWWPKSYGQNHWDLNNTSLGFAALALDGEDARAATWLTHVVTEMRKDSSNLDNITDGTWHEGCLYQHSKLVYTMALTYSSYLTSWGGWLSAGGYSLLNLAASEAGSGEARWLSQQLETEHGRSSYQAAKHIAEFFYYNPQISPVPPGNKPGWLVLRDLEGVIWRTGWGAGDLVFGLKTGAYGGRYLYEQYLNKQYPFDMDGANLNVGHNHADANTFWLYRGKTTLAAELGGRSVWGSPTSAYLSRVHNTLLVDGKGQYWSQNHAGVYANTDGRLLDTWNTQGYNFMSADAAKRYREEKNDGTPGTQMINEFRRHVLFVRPSLLLMIDRVSGDSPHRYEWLCYFSDSARVTAKDGWTHVDAEANNVLGIRTLSPAMAVTSIVDSIKPGVIIRPPANTAQTHFVNALLPTTDGVWANKPAIEMVAQNDSAVCINLTDGARHAYVVNLLGASYQVRLAGYSLTGSAGGVVKKPDGTTRALVILGGTELADNSGARPLLSLSRGGAVEAWFNGDTLRVLGDISGGLRIYAPVSSANRVTVNGSSVQAVREGDYLLISGVATRPPPNTPPHSNLRGIVINRIAGSRAISISFVAQRNGTADITLYTIHGRCLAAKHPFIEIGKECRIRFNTALLSNNALVIVVIKQPGFKAQQYLRVQTL